MSTFEIISSILLAVSCVILVAIVLAQHGKSNYLGGAVSGGAAETFLGKSKAKTVDIILSRYTKIVAAVFVILTLIVNAASIIFRH